MVSRLGGSKLSQFDTSVGGKAGVQSQYLDGERYLVDHALAGAMSATEQFKVFQTIFGALAVYVMYGFFWVKFAAQVLLHHVAMFEHFRLFAVVRQRGYGQPDVPVTFNVTSDVAGFKTFVGSGFLRSRFAFLAAIFLLSVYAKFFCVAASYFKFAAMFAGKSVSRVGVLFSSYVRAVHRAVQGIAVKLFLVSFQVGLHHNEGFTAFAAGKVYRRAARSVYSFFVQMVSSAFHAAVFTAFFRFAYIAVERLFAAFTRHLDRHGYVPLVSDKLQRSCAVRGSQIELYRSLGCPSPA